MLDKLNPDNKIFLFGPVTGRLGQLNPYNVEAQSIDDDLRRASQVIGRFMEGGVLRKEDEEKYRKMLPQLTDTPDVARNKLEGVKQLLSDKATQMVNDYITGGYDATDFIGVLSDIGGQGKKYNEIDDYIKTVGADEYGQKLQEMPGNTIEEKRENLLDWINQGDTSGFNQGGGGTPTASTGMRTDRHNNPTAFTTDIAKIAGLKEGVDYVPGDPFSGGKYKTAKLLGDPVDTTIKVIDKIGFYTQSGGQRWTHTAISKAQWDKMSYNQKKNVVKQMYQKEGNQGQLNQYFA
ncbi:MAG: hypothetical protein M1308_13600 [Actinobacteria bacterium]|nr:hypothetical protein [Actinomycetota bacterium]